MPSDGNDGWLAVQAPNGEAGGWLDAAADVAAVDDDAAAVDVGVGRYFLDLFLLLSIIML